VIIITQCLLLWQYRVQTLGKR